MGTQYCFPADLVSTGINPIALQDVPTATQTQACIDASEIADSYMRGRYQLPLLAFGRDIVFRTSQIAIWMILKARGFNPDAGADTYWAQEYNSAIHWFEGVQRQSVHPDVTPGTPQPGDPVHDLPQVITSTQRGWGQFGRGGAPSVS